MIKWYDDKENVGILFNIIPSVGIRYILPSDTPAVKKSKKKYPFVNKRDLQVRLLDYKKLKNYNFIIPKGYCYDGMTIPRFAWTLIGVSKENNCGLIASMIHDYLTEQKQLIKNDRAFSTNVFNALLEEGGISPIKRFFMKNSVACYQTLFCNW